MMLEEVIKSEVSYKDILGPSMHNDGVTLVSEIVQKLSGMSLRMTIFKIVSCMLDR